MASIASGFGSQYYAQHAAERTPCDELWTKLGEAEFIGVNIPAEYAAEPRVSEAVVIGLPHEHWTEAITAVVVPRPDKTIDPAGLLQALHGQLDGYKVPKSVIVVDELPKTSTGKIQKNVVRDQHASHYGG